MLLKYGCIGDDENGKPLFGFSSGQVRPLITGYTYEGVWNYPAGGRPSNDSNKTIEALTTYFGNIFKERFKILI